MCYFSSTISLGKENACGAWWALIRISHLHDPQCCCDEPLVRLESLIIAKNFILG